MSSDDKTPVPNRRTSDPHSSQNDLDARLERLKMRLDESNSQRDSVKNDPDSPENQRNRSGVAMAFKLSSEFIAGVVVGAGIGYFFDKFFGTTPWGMIFFFMIGFAAAILNVLRSAGMVSESEMRLKPAHNLHQREQDAKSGGSVEK